MKIILCAGSHGRVIIIGDVESAPVPGQPVELRDARMVLYWDRACGGLLGLAARGPAGETRITHAVGRTVETVWQEWILVSDTAAEEIAKWPAC